MLNYSTVKKGLKSASTKVVNYCILEFCSVWRMVIANTTPKPLWNASLWSFPQVEKDLRYHNIVECWAIFRGSGKGYLALQIAGQIKHREMLLQQLLQCFLNVVGGNKCSLSFKTRPDNFPFHRLVWTF